MSNKVIPFGLRFEESCDAQNSSVTPSYDPSVQYSIIKIGGEQTIPFVLHEAATKSLPTETYTKERQEGTDADAPPRRRPKRRPQPRPEGWGVTVTETVETTD